MKPLLDGAIGWTKTAGDGWNRFWFTPAEPHTLAAIRIATGLMLFYTHLVWGKNLMAFLGPNAWIPNDLVREMHRGGFTWSYLWYIESPALLWAVHLVALVVFAMLTIGLFTRVTSILAWLIAVAYCHRLSGAFFGLDQINSMLAMYLMIGQCGAVYSVDHWRARRRAGQGVPAPAISTNVAIRLIQLHMCIIYLFGGISKLRGSMWWDGSAVWYAVANVEYQSLDMTWLVHFPWLIALLTHVTVFWETFYCALVWPRLTRPFTLFLAVCVHGGIAMFLGMITFGIAMIIGNAAFVAPQTVQSLVAAVQAFGRRLASRNANQGSPRARTSEPTGKRARQPSGISHPSRV